MTVSRGYGRVWCPSIFFECIQKLLSEAIIKRSKTGEGSTIKTSMFGGMVEWLSPGYYIRLTVTTNNELVAPPGDAPYGAYECANGELIFDSSTESERMAVYATKFLKHQN